jgi:putative transposase
MVRAVKALKHGTGADEVSRSYGVSKGTLYNWKSMYSETDVSQVKRLKELEEENRRLKKMYSDLTLDYDGF